MLIKRTERQARRGSLAAAIGNQTGGGFDRRTFLRKSGLVGGGLATIGALILVVIAVGTFAATSWNGENRDALFAIIRSAGDAVGVGKPGTPAATAPAPIARDSSPPHRCRGEARRR